MLQLWIMCMCVNECIGVSALLWISEITFPSVSDQFQIFTLPLSCSGSLWHEADSLGPPPFPASLWLWVIYWQPFTLVGLLKPSVTVNLDISDIPTDNPGLPVLWPFISSGLGVPVPVHPVSILHVTVPLHDYTLSSFWLWHFILEHKSFSL